ncbi:MAG: serine/threonine-protein kinase [Chloroflexota bacterium]
MELTEGLDFGPYRLVSRAGAGGMAEVWRAYDVRLKRYIAVKFLSPRYGTDPEYLERFAREAQAVSRLDHPNILPIYDFGEQDGWTYMISPFVSGGTLAARLRRGPWSVEAALKVLEPLAAALDYAHGRGIVHRDIKPSNVLMGEDDRVLLSDFGIALIVESSTVMSQAGLVVGTPMYMSPEQADGQRAGPASDRYSLGVVAYEMLTGRAPFLGETPIALLRAHIDKPLPPPRSLNPDLPDAAEAALLAIMAKNPEHRFATGGAFIAVLRRALTTSATGRVNDTLPRLASSDPGSVIGAAAIVEPLPSSSMPAPSASPDSAEMVPAASAPTVEAATRPFTRSMPTLPTQTDAGGGHGTTAILPERPVDAVGVRWWRGIWLEAAAIGAIVGILAVWLVLQANERWTKTNVFHPGAIIAETGVLFNAPGFVGDLAWSTFPTVTTIVIVLALAWSWLQRRTLVHEPLSMLGNLWLMVGGVIEIAGCFVGAMQYVAGSRGVASLYFAHSDYMMFFTVDLARSLLHMGPRGAQSIFEYGFMGLAIALPFAVLTSLLGLAIGLVVRTRARAANTTPR